MKPATLFILPAIVLAAGCNTTGTATDGYTYTCESGTKVTASYPDTDSAQVTYLGDEYSMRIAISASGSRYVDDRLEWWTKGAEGTLLQHSENGETHILEQCRQQR